MVGGVALRVAGARVVRHTRVKTVGVDAHLGDGAFRIAAAANWKKHIGYRYHIGLVNNART
jgi:hypothetical protein